MKAAIYTRYGPPDVVQITDVEKPSPKDSESLSESTQLPSTHSIGTSCEARRISSAFIAGLRHPKDPRLGVDVAGQVEAVGRSVTRFQAGDAVFGACRGAFAGSSR